MRNSDSAKPKMSNIDKMVNYHILYILVIQIFCCLVLAIVFSVRCYKGVFIIINYLNRYS